MNITINELCSLVAEPYFSRGKKYFKEGLIEIQTSSEKQVQAQAAGSMMYQITIKRTNKNLIPYCSCQAFSDYGPCKHIAATCLALIELQSNRKYKPSEEYFERANEYANVQKYLNGLTKKELTSLLMQFASENSDIMYELNEIAQD